MSDLIERLNAPTGAILDSSYVVIASDDWERCRAEREEAAERIAKLEADYEIAIDAWNREIDRNAAIQEVETDE